MAKTDAQKTADQALEDAVHGVVKAYGLMPETAVPTNFVVCGEGILFDKDDPDDFAEYSYQAYRWGSMSTSTALGIVTLAADDLREGRSIELLDDDENG